MKQQCSSRRRFNTRSPRVEKVSDQPWDLLAPQNFIFPESFCDKAKGQTVIHVCTDERTGLRANIGESSGLTGLWYAVVFLNTPISQICLNALMPIKPKNGEHVWFLVNGEHSEASSE